MRLIDADPLYEEACTLEARALDYFGKLLKERTGDEVRTERRIWAAILNERTAFKQDVFDAPTVNACEVIRCKDCKWYGEPGCAIRIVDDTDKPSDMDFCSFAERRTENETQI